LIRTTAVDALLCLFSCLDAEISALLMGATIGLDASFGLSLGLFDAESDATDLGFGGTLSSSSSSLNV